MVTSAFNLQPCHHICHMAFQKVQAFCAGMEKLLVYRTYRKLSRSFKFLSVKFLVSPQEGNLGQK